MRRVNLGPSLLQIELRSVRISSVQVGESGKHSPSEEGTNGESRIEGSIAVRGGRRIDSPTTAQTVKCVKQALQRRNKVNYAA